MDTGSNLSLSVFNVLLYISENDLLLQIRILFLSYSSYFSRIDLIVDYIVPPKNESSMHNSIPKTSTVTSAPKGFVSPPGLCDDFQISFKHRILIF